MMVGEHLCFAAIIPMLHHIVRQADMIPQSSVKLNGEFNDLATVSEEITKGEGVIELCTGLLEYQIQQQQVILPSAGVSRKNMLPYRFQLVVQRKS